MKKPIIAAAMAIACVAPQAFAQSANFQGMSVGVGLNAADTRTEVQAAGLTTKRNDVDYNLALQLNYNWALGNAVVLGLGGATNLGDQKAGKFGNNQFTIRNSFSLHIAPGLAINNKWLAYGKLAYLQANVRDGSGNTVTFDDGMGYGLGVQTLFDKHWFGQVEYMDNDYGSKNTPTAPRAKLRSEMLTLSVGYKY